MYKIFFLATLFATSPVVAEYQYGYEMYSIRDQLSLYQKVTNINYKVSCVREAVQKLQKNPKNKKKIYKEILKYCKDIQDQLGVSEYDTKNGEPCWLE